MKARFVIGTSNMSAENVKNFVSHLENIHAAWWHYLPNFWLVWTHDESLTAQKLRDALKQVAGGPNCLVMKVQEDIDWSSLGNQKNANGGPWVDWLSRSWAKDD